MSYINTGKIGFNPTKIYPLRKRGAVQKEDLTGWKMWEHGVPDSRLIVLRQAPSDGTEKRKWICRCSCGNSKELIVPTSHLKSGHTKSCGCIKAENTTKALLIDMTGWVMKEHGVPNSHLTVVKRGPNSNTNHSQWYCKCDCGNPNLILIDGTALRNGHTISCGCIHSKGEEKIQNILIQAKIPFEKQKTFPGCYRKNPLPFDFYVNQKYLIEYDGEQHFCEGNNWGRDNFNEIHNNDEIKNQWCKNNNIPLIRIPYTHYNNLVLKDLILETSTFLLGGENGSSG